MAEDDSPLDAGDFAGWLTDMRSALRGEQDATVPCGGCTACCKSSQFVHVDADETDTLAHIPAELLFAAPRSSPATLVMGYDENGQCPMLVDDACSIYEHRPRTCRTYDCRLFAATGVTIDKSKPAIARRVGRWRFTFVTDDDRAAYAAVQAAGTIAD